MPNTTGKLLLIAALTATAACSKKPPKQLPPPPPVEGERALPQPNDNGGMSNTTIPGSAADFKAKVGSDTVLFATDSYDIDGEARSILERQAQWLQQYPNVRITIEGHCEERGTR